MASKKISSLATLATPDAVDELVIVDKSDTTMAGTGTDKKVTYADLVGDDLAAQGAELVDHESRLDIVEGTYISKAIADAKGDLLVATGADAFTRKAVGADGTMLVADTAAGGGVKWGTPADVGAIAKTLVDAKGDILVATADDTPARKAVGANDTYLRGDSTKADGLAWGMQSSMNVPYFRTGAYHAPPGLSGQGFGDSSTAGRVLALLFPVSRRTTFDRIGFWLQANYGAGSLVRLGVYTIRTNLHPNALVVDSGDIDCTAGAPVWKEANINITLDAGVYIVLMAFKTGWTVGTGQMLRVQQGVMVGGPGANNNTVGPSSIGTGSAYGGGALPDPGQDLAAGTELNQICIKLRVA